MKDLNDVVSYLNNVLGPHHDLTIAARQEAEKSTTDSELFRKDECQVIFYVLSGMICEVTSGQVDWKGSNFGEQTKDYIHNIFGLDEIVFELEIDEKYPEESDELIALGMKVDEIIDTPELFNKLVRQIEIDCAGDALANMN